MPSYAIATAPSRNSRHWVQSDISWDEVVSWMSVPSSIKECGNYLFGTIEKSTIDHGRGPCTNLHRRKQSIASRSVVTLDVDHPSADFLRQVERVWTGGVVLIHTTYSSAPDEPRYRVLIPTDRQMSPSEYSTVARALMSAVDASMFDPGSDQPERYMFKPSEQKPGWFSWTTFGEGPWDTDALITDDDEVDHKQDAAVGRKRSPFELAGWVGAFNRAYTLDDAISAYGLPYEQATDNRWRLVGADSVAGLAEVSPGIYYSHHAKDPARETACSVFDLLRIHRFGSLDEGVPPTTPPNRLPSSEAAIGLIRHDKRVLAELWDNEIDEAMNSVADDLGWLTKLDVAKNGTVRDNPHNWDVLFDHGVPFKVLYYNQLTMSIEISGDLPWRTVDQEGPMFNGSDIAHLLDWLERTARLSVTKDRLSDKVIICSRKRYVNPIRDYLTSLEWDGRPRLETCLPGVRPTAYTRMVAKKSMVAAVARALDPGCKWDHTLVLFGSEGLGKSYWIHRVSRGWSATLGRIGDKDTLLTMKRNWIMVSDEGYSLRKADADVQKEFLTRQDDTFRAPYDPKPLVHKRNCVIWGTTNDEVFLRRQEGNRRFLIVRCEERVDFDSLTDAYIDQLWAEAVHYYRDGELLYLGDDESLMAAAEREQFTEEDGLSGLLAEYLDTPVPENWDDMSKEDRYSWRVESSMGGIAKVGTRLIDRVCVHQMWEEALNRRRGEADRQDRLEIATALRRLGWVALPGRHRLPNYGPQLVFIRPAEDEELI